jgi:DNA repair exonuclease SbcCD ATPase subunit
MGNDEYRNESDLAGWDQNKLEGLREFVSSLESVLNAKNREIERLRAQVKDLQEQLHGLTACPDCNGQGHRWYALRGTESCLTCHGTGERR